MSRLSKLITELCPDGVQYATLGQIASFRKGATKARADMQEGPYPVVAGGLEPAFYCNEFNRAGETIAVSSSGVNAGFVSYWNSPIMLTDAFSVEPDEEVVVTKYLYYALANMQLRIFSKKKGAGVPHVYSTDISTLRIPLPPLAIQHEIVRVLDQFTGLITELEAELAARKKQYEYYRDSLLAFDDTVPRRKLGDVCDLLAGGDVPKRFSKEPTDEFRVPIYTNGVGANALHGYTNQARITVPCVTIAARGTIGSCELRRVPFYPAIRLICAIPHDDLRADYLKYAIETIRFSVPTSGIPQLTLPMVARYKIPVPLPSEQERIAKILDRFDALVNDLSSGIPAEIEARRKQYEYYRDKLLSFKEAKR